MVEVILGVYITSFLLSCSLIFWHFNHVKATTQSQKLQILNSNLQKVSQFWSCANAQFAPLTEDCIERDRKKSLHSVLYLGLLAFGSLIGLILLFMVIISIRYIAKSRLERAVFQSALVEDANLSASEIHQLMDQLRSNNF